MSGKVFSLSVDNPVRSATIRKPKGVTVKDRLAFLGWMDLVMLDLLKLANLQNCMVAWADHEAGRYVISLAVEVQFPFLPDEQLAQLTTVVIED